MWRGIGEGITRIMRRTESFMRKLLFSNINLTPIKGFRSNFIKGFEEKKLLAPDRRLDEII